MNLHKNYWFIRWRGRMFSIIAKSSIQIPMSHRSSHSKFRVNGPIIRFNEPIYKDDRMTQEELSLNQKDGAVPIVILMADDDEDDRMMTREAFAEVRLLNNFFTVSDGEELMDYLLRRNKYVDAKDAPMPGLILLDLNMPKKDGREALVEIKKNPVLRRIPVVILTTSKTEEDILRTYDLGVNSFINKPVSFNQLVEIIRTLTKYWFQIVQLPT